MATNQQNINIGTADNANDGDVLRAAFRKVRKMFAEIYGDTDAENLTDTETVPATSFDTHITEKIEDTVGAMFAGGTQTNVTVTYDDSDGSIDLNVAADITDVNAGAGLTGTNESGGAATLSVGAGNGITVNANNIAVDANLQVTGNESIGIPSGTTTQRNAITTPVSGMFRFNTTDSQFEGYDGTAWGEIGGDSGSSTLYVDTFDGDGSDVTFDLSQSIEDENNTQVYIDGVYQSKSTYSTSGTTITFSEAPATGTDNIEVIHIKALTSINVADNSVTTSKIQNNAVTTAKLNINSVTHDKLENRYTETSTSASTGSLTLNASAATTFLLTGNVATATYTIENMKTGQTIDILLSGTLTSAVITLADDFTTSTISRVGTGELDTAETNLIQVTCLDDTDSAAKLVYTINKYETDTTP